MVPPWAADVFGSGGNLLETALGSCSSRVLSDWRVPEEFEAAIRMSDEPNAPPGTFWSARRWVMLIFVLMAVKGSLLLGVLFGSWVITSATLCSLLKLFISGMAI